MSTPDWWLVILTVFAVVGGFWLIYLTKQTMIEANRAWVLPLAERNRDLVFKRPAARGGCPYQLGTVEVLFQNLGNGPALNMISSGTYRSADEHAQPDPNPLPGPVPGLPMLPMLAPSEIYRYPVWVCLFRREIAEAWKRHGGIFAMWITYSDQFGEARHTKVGLSIFREGTGRFRAVMRTAENYAD